MDGVFNPGEGIFIPLGLVRPVVVEEGSHEQAYSPATRLLAFVLSKWVFGGIWPMEKK